jgi:hypothetical protein
MEPTVREQSIIPTVKEETISREDAVKKAFPQGFVRAEDKPPVEKKVEEKPEEKKAEEKPPVEEKEVEQKKAEEKPPEEEKKPRKSLLNRREETEEKAPEEDAWKEPEGLEEKAKVDFRRLKASRDNEIAALQEKLKHLETSAADPEIDRLKEENTALAQKLKEIDFQATPEFENTFVKPREDSMRKLTALAKEHNLDVSIESLLSKKGKDLGDAVSEATESLPDFYRTEFIDEVRKVLDVDRSRSEALQDASKYREGLHQRRRQQQEQALDKVWGNLAGEHGYLIEPLGGDSEEDKAYDTAAAALKTQVRSYTSEAMSEEDIASVSTKAAFFDFMISQAFPRMEQDYQELLKLNQDQSAKLEACKGQNPTLHTGQGGHQTAPKSREELVNKIFGPQP